ncbi:hypothetical protein ACFOWT_05750 [Croceibacterium xixiisoli]|nr:hypothetical protein [Croceibacterium xixiisoli]
MSSTKKLRESLRQMLALLEGERQALASLDLERILTCADGKVELCAAIDRHKIGDVDEECRGLLDGVSRLNEINRKLRNLIAANVQSRLSVLSGSASLYGSTVKSSSPRREMPRLV